MQLNELIEQYSIKDISAKTRIAPENLENLHGRDWNKMRKVQALGFINILEREYNIDLSSLRKECLEYYNNHQQGLGGEHLELQTINDNGLKGNLIAQLQKIGIFVFIILLAVGSWYIFVKKDNSDELALVTDNTTKKGFYNSMINMAHNIMSENNKSINPELELDGNKKRSAKDEVKDKKDEVAKATKEKSDNTITDEKSNEKLTLAYAKESDTKTEDNAQDDTKKDTKEESKPLKITDVIPSSNTITQESSTKQDNKKSEDSTNRDDTAIADDNLNMVTTVLDTEVPSLAKNKKDSAKVESDINKSQNGKPTATGVSVVIMQPGSKVWIGYRELRSGKRTAEVTKDAVTFDTTKSDYILATGHGILTFKNGNDKELLKLHDGKKHFFMIAKGGVREISHEKFQQLNGSKVW